MASGVTPQQVYQALIGAGASTVAAIGIMANGIAESGLDPESIGDQGTSFGIWQQHGSQYAGLVTGNPQGDMNAQVRVVASNGGFAAASGATGAEAAGNFAAGYERCTTCQPGQASYNNRVGNASTVAGWVSSGAWPASAGAASAGSAGGSAPPAGPDCAFSVGGQHIGLIFGHGPSLPSACLVRKTEVRAIMGGLLMLAGAGPFLLGALIVAAGAIGETKTGQAAARTAGKVAEVAPVARVVAIPAQRRQRRQQRTRAAAQQQRAQQQQVRQGNTQARRAVGGPAQQRRAVSGRAPRQAPPPRQQRAPQPVHHP